MTSVLPESDSTVSCLKLKLQNPKSFNNARIRDEARSFLNFSRENLSISHSDIEQGFNKSRYRPNIQTILSVTSILIALVCLSLEIWKLKCVVKNQRDIDVLKRDIESLQHRFLEEDLLDELKAFEEQLYAEETDGGDDDPGETDIDNAEYDSSYDEELPSSHDYSGDYQTSGVFGRESTSIRRSDSLNIDGSTSSTDKNLEEVLATLHKAEIKRGSKFEKSVRENHKNIEHERLLEKEKARNGRADRGKSSDFAKTQKQRRSIHDTITQKDETAKSETPIASHSNKHGNRSRDTKYISGLLSEDDKESERGSTVSPKWDRFPPKKYHAAARPETSHTAGPGLELHSVENLQNGYGHPSPARVGDIRRLHLSESHDSESYGGGRRGFNNTTIPIGSKEKAQRRISRRHLRAPRLVHATHYGADSTLFSEDDEHTGNGRARHGEGIFKAWKPSSWVADLGMNKYFSLETNGRLTVNEPGLYLVYAQIHYLDEHDENGFHVLIDNRPIMQCMVYSPGTGHKSRSCFSAQATLLQAGDTVTLKDIGTSRYTLFQHDKSFFGLVKLGDMRQKHQQLPPPQ